MKPAKYNPRKDLQPGDPEYDALRWSMGEFGCVEPLVWNERTGNLVGGHQRLKVLLEQGETETEVVVVDLDEGREKQLNVALNKIGGEWDLPKLADVFEEIGKLDLDVSLTGFSEEEIAELLVQGMENQNPLSSGCEDLLGGQSDEVSIEGGQAFQLKEDIRFESNLPYDFPPLRSDRLADCPDDGIICWAGPDATPEAPQYLYNYHTDSTRGLDPLKTVLAFYTDDYRWEKDVWDFAEKLTAKIINSKILTCVSPNFSTWWKWPQARRLWNFFRARWVSRYWQEAGIKIIPDLQYPPKDYHFCFAGIPNNAPCLATQWHTEGDSPDFLEQKRIGLALAIKVMAPGEKHRTDYASFRRNN